MFNRHVSDRLAALIDSELSAREARQVETHLAECASCQQERQSILGAVDSLCGLPLVEAPDSIWLSINAELRKAESPKPQARRYWNWALAATALLVLACIAYWRVALLAPGWEVSALGGSPVVAGRHIGAIGQIRAGESVETDSGSRAEVKVGRIGFLEIAPNTRLRVVTEKPNEHRLALARGQIHARISAPPRLFFVETASGTAVDLGCEYTLDADESGFGTLRVSKGWVSFQWNGQESLVPAGAVCRTKPLVGPGIPYFEDAAGGIKQALENAGAEAIGENALSAILAESRIRDTLTLWHLLSRVRPADRERVLDRMVVLSPLPQGVSREQALKLDPGALKRWREELAWNW